MSVKRVLLIITGGIAAYKSLDLIRRLLENGYQTKCVLTAGAREFITPLSVSALSGDLVSQDLFSLTEESEMGHIRLARDTDLVVVAPATADFMAKMAHGLADDLASTIHLATDRPLLLAPAMNPAMWSHPATQANVAVLAARGARFVGPDKGDMACGETGTGRMAEVAEIVDAVDAHFGAEAGKPEVSLVGHTALVTSGPTHEPIDPVRYIANRSSGRQGHAIARALRSLGASVHLVSGPTDLPDPVGVHVTHVTTAQQMWSTCQAALPVDIAVCAAAVADWRVDEVAPEKLKKTSESRHLSLSLVKNPDILADIAASGVKRPHLLVGFAAETENVVAFARSKRSQKGCDWIVANDVSASGNAGRGDTFGGQSNTVHLVSADGVEDWPTLPKDDVANRLAQRIALQFSGELQRSLAQ